MRSLSQRSQFLVETAEILFRLLKGGDFHPVAASLDREQSPRPRTSVSEQRLDPVPG